ncbi:MAG: hypothetical protein F6K42_09945 [Leptolyngbya sp. SIO1D8]|nr:hypothetical protein [Leptolyngbya sp. SIO1D8]
MLIPLLIAQVSTADYTCWMETPYGQVIDMAYLCETAPAIEAEVSEASAPQESPVTFVLQQDGRLEPGDQIAPDGSLFDRYSFEGQAGQSVTITVTSEDFDTYLLLLDNTESVLAQNDDTGFNSTNSALSITLPADGTYQVVVNSFWSDGQGNYSLTIQAQESITP